MEKFEGRMKGLHLDAVRNYLRNYARYTDNCARKTESYATELAMEAERLNRNAPATDIMLDAIKQRYESRINNSGDHLLIKVDPLETGAFLSLASGCRRVPLTNACLRQLAIYENMKTGMMRMYDEVANIDGVFLFDLKTNISLFRTEYMFAGDIPPGVDLKILYDIGLTFYDWFKFVDKPSNPARKALWYPMAFIAVEHDWIMHLKAPLYSNRYLDNEEMIGLIGIHLNLDWLAANTIAKSAVRMMIVKDDATLIALNEPAAKQISLPTYKKSDFNMLYAFDPAVTQKKKKFVYETLNLDHHKSPDVELFSKRLKSEFQFNHTMLGKEFKILRERAPELGLNFVALLEAD